MTPENAKKLLPIIQAFADGKAIQYQANLGLWDSTTALDFNRAPERYRIKPEPIAVKYRLALYKQFNQFNVYAVPPSDYKIIESWINEKLYGYIKWLGDEQATFVDSDYL